MEDLKLEFLELGLDLFKSSLEINRLHKELENMFQNGIQMSSAEFNEAYRILSEKIDRWAEMEKHWKDLESRLVPEEHQHEEFYTRDFIDQIAEKLAEEMDISET